jgi:hypothetical protein
MPLQLGMAFTATTRKVAPSHAHSLAPPQSLTPRPLLSVVSVAVFASNAGLTMKSLSSPSWPAPR